MKIGPRLYFLTPSPQQGGQNRLVPGFFKASLSGASARQAVVEDTGASAWLYLTEPEDPTPIAACFLYNGIAPGGADPDGPPPLDPQFASGFEVPRPVSEDDIEIFWSLDGDAAAVRIHGLLVAYITAADPVGFSRSVSEDCPWAHLFDVGRFNELWPSSTITGFALEQP